MIAGLVSRGQNHGRAMSVGFSTKPDRSGSTTRRSASTTFLRSTPASKGTVWSYTQEPAAAPSSQNVTPYDPNASVEPSMSLLERQLSPLSPDRVGGGQIPPPIHHHNSAADQQNAEAARSAADKGWLAIEMASVMPLMAPDGAFSTKPTLQQRTSDLSRMMMGGPGVHRPRTQSLPLGQSRGSRNLSMTSNSSTCWGDPSRAAQQPPPTKKSLSFDAYRDLHNGGSPRRRIKAASVQITRLGDEPPDTPRLTPV